MIRFMIVLIMLLPQSLWAQAGSRWETRESLEQAKEHLLKRKKAFEKHLIEEERRRQLRRAEADKQKAIRKKYAQKMEKARRQFRRQEYKFPQKAYKKFVEARKKKNERLEKARQHYSIIQRELREVHKNKKYRIDGRKEFKL